MGEPDVEAIEQYHLQFGFDGHISISSRYRCTDAVVASAGRAMPQASSFDSRKQKQRQTALTKLSISLVAELPVSEIIAQHPSDHFENAFGSDDICRAVLRSVRRVGETGFSASATTNSKSKLLKQQMD
jgi:hypothetical protein